MIRLAAAAVLDLLEREGELLDVRGVLPSSFSGVADDSRIAGPGSLFVAIKGSAADGHDYLDGATERGAGAAVVTDRTRTARLPLVVVRDSRRVAGLLAALAYGHPSSTLRAVAVTGTNGKSTTVAILRHLLDSESAPAASIGTLGVLLRSEGQPFPGGAGLTTPGPVELQRILSELVATGVQWVAMEVSSHALDQERVAGTLFAAAVFTNFTRDHLDYHRTMEAYLAAKLRLAEYLAEDAPLVVNADVAAWAPLITRSGVVRYGLLSPQAEVRASEISVGGFGSRWELHAGGESAAVHLPLLGDFNVQNALAAAAAAWSLGMPLGNIAARLADVPQVPGRLERLADQPLVLRDYAHTPDALGRLLDAARGLTRGRLIVVFGCGGDRDRGKRPMMGAVASQKADLAIVTSDNPRTEDPERIIDEIVAGMGAAPYERIEDRRAAIARALDRARPGDVVVLAGKGHETYQIRGTTRYPFDEREVVAELLGTR